MQKKIKVLWLINTVLPQAAEAFHLNQNVYGGWLTALIKGITEQSAINLIVVFPNFKSSGVERAEKDGIVLYSVAMPSIHHRYHPETEIHFKAILKKENPDVVHIFGTEFPHALAMVRAFDTPKQTLIHIQGLCSFIALHYLDGIPAKVLKKKSLKELLNGKGMVYDQFLFYERAKFETDALIRSGHVDGRTTWDKACALQINDALKYHYCSESLRDGFYHLRWDINQIERHTVFISQATYPVKGFHLALEAFAKVVERYPDAKMVVAGANIFGWDEGWLKRYIKSSYVRYILNLVDKYRLKNHIVFTGELNEADMCAQYAKAHVFVSPSVIENSPNSVCEAMLLGMPCVCSDVGGIRDLMTHEEQGYIYQSSAPYMLAYYICDLFANDQKAIQFSEAAHERAKQTHDRKANVKRTLEIYDIIKREADA